MERFSDLYKKYLLGRVQAKLPRVPFYSSVSGRLYTDGAGLGPDYWVSNLVSRVRFSDAVNQILGTMSEQKIFLEIGPHSALAGPVRQCLTAFGSTTDEHMGTLTRGNNSQIDMANVLGKLWLQRQQPRFDKLVGSGRFLVDLPLYPWHYEEPLWRESRLAREYRLREFPHHDILGSRVLESTQNDPSWRNLLRLDSVPWIKEHEIKGKVIFPAVGYICMAGEAVRQLTGSREFTVKRFHIKTALFMQRGEDVEVITQLHQQYLTHSDKSKWYEFTISTQQQGSWVRHAFGRVSAGDYRESDHRVVREICAFPRKVDRKAWYRKMRGMGLEYGPRFCGLTDMSSHLVHRKMAATVQNGIREGESIYAIHPGALDCMIQAIAPASCNGLTRRFHQLAIPTYMDEIYIRPPPNNDLKILVVADDEPDGAYSAGIICQSEGALVVEVKNIQMSMIDDDDDDVEGGVDRHAAVELQWKEDVNLLDIGSLFSRKKDRTATHNILDQFATTCMLEVNDQLNEMSPSGNHFDDYRLWLQQACADILKDQSNGTRDTTFHGKETSRQRHIARLYARLLETDASSASTAVWRTMNSCKDIYTGKANALDLLMEENILDKLYDFMQNTEYQPFLDLLSHRKPTLRILEIGAGTGGTTATILPALVSSYGERMYCSYTYTDISPGFFDAAQERFKEYEAIEYRVLDISKDPVQQGFEAEKYDLVVACNVSLFFRRVVQNVSSF